MARITQCQDDEKKALNQPQIPAIRGEKMSFPFLRWKNLKAIFIARALNFTLSGAKEMKHKEQRILTQLSFWGKQHNLLGTADGARNIFALLLATSHNIFGIFTQPHNVFSLNGLVKPARTYWNQ